MGTLHMVLKAIFLVFNMGIQMVFISSNHLVPTEIVLMEILRRGAINGGVVRKLHPLTCATNGSTFDK